MRNSEINVFPFESIRLNAVTASGRDEMYTTFRRLLFPENERMKMDSPALDRKMSINTFVTIKQK